jgi:hypothetical protein
MAAAAFKGVIKFQAQSGVTFNYPITATDINAAYYIFPDGNGDVVLPSMYGTLYLVDVVLSASGTDTSTGTIFVNGKTTGELIMNAANLGTNFSRQFLGSPIAIMPGARLRIQQNT